MKHWQILATLIAGGLFVGLLITMKTSSPELRKITISRADLDRRIREFEKSAYPQEAVASEKVIADFDRFYDLVKQALESTWTFSDGGLDDADFSSSRYVAPGKIVTVVANRPVTEDVARRLLLACETMGEDYAVLFDGLEGESIVFGNGEFWQASRD